MVRFGYGYDQTPLQIFSSGRKSQRISLRAADKLRAAPYTIPFKPRADTATVRSRLEEQKREGNRNISNREKVGGGIRKKPRFYDIDYSYERIELRDRMLDILPAPPPYSDTLFNYNIDTNPSAPPPETSDYGHKDTTTNPDEDDPKQDPDEDDPKQDPDEDDPKQDPDDTTDDTSEYTKESWQKIFKREDGTYWTDGISFPLDNDVYQTMDSNTWSFLRYYLTFEMNYTFPNSIIGQDTKIKLSEVQDPETGKTNLAFKFLWNGEEAWFSIPSANGTTPSSPTLPPPGDSDNDTNTAEAWKNQNVDTEGLYKIPTDDFKTTTSLADSKVTDVYKPEDFYGINSPETQWLKEYMRNAMGLDVDAMQNTLWINPQMYWAFVVVDIPDNNGQISAYGSKAVYVQTMFKNTNSSTLIKSIPINLGSTPIPYKGQSANPNNTGEIISNAQPTADEKFDGIYTYKDPKTGAERYKLPTASFKDSKPEFNNPYTYRLSDTEWNWLQDYMKYSSSYVETGLSPQSRDVGFMVQNYSNPKRLVLLSPSQNGIHNTFGVTILL